MTWRDASFGIWAFVALLIVGVATAAAVSGGRLAGLGDVFRKLTNGRLRRAALLVGWMWLGWHFFAR